MKTRMFAIAAIASSLIGGGALVASNAFAQSTIPPRQSGVGAGGSRQERHPEIRKSLRQLNNALTTMKNAADDFKGHKEAAMDDTQKAIAELQAALKADKT